ncbi:hypothetical protein AX16_003531 [Volvariella volvacea WC 439]|nr:hypothetical protein AX16_003531 [Volvariella volvacea WC 439]
MAASDELPRPHKIRRIERASSDDLDASGWSATLYNRVASFVYSQAYTSPILNLLSPKPGERIIDFGCGSGEVSLEIERAVQQKKGGTVVGLDFSESMVSKARANGLKNAFVADIQELSEDKVAQCGGKFDAVFSNAALHWCKKNPKGVLESARKVLKPGGRLVVEMGGFMNCIGARSAIHHVLRTRGYDPVALDPWYFPSMEDYVRLLVTSSFEPTHMSLTPRITPLPQGLREWLRVFVRGSFLRDFPEEEAEDILSEVVDICRTDCQDASGKWALVYMRLRFSAVMKGGTPN